jgi:hypothetical protein
VILVNHMLADMGGYGMITPGGDALKFGCASRLRLKRTETFDDGSFEATITVDKLRHGGKAKARSGRAMFVPGVGISVGLTNAFDCMEWGHARRKNFVQVRKELGKDEWSNVCKLSELFEWARGEKSEKFEVFEERLQWKELDG